MTKHYCIDCKKIVSFYAKRCRSCGQKTREHSTRCNCAICKSKRKEFVGKNHPMFGKRPLESSIKALIKYNKLSLPKTEEHKIKIGLANKGKIRSKEVITRIIQSRRKSILNKGKFHYNYKNGRTPLYMRIRNLTKYKEWREKVYKRDSYTCTKCKNNLGGNLNAHHKYPFAKLLNEFLQEYNTFSPVKDKETLVRLAVKWKPFWNINNGITLCKYCHKDISRITYK